MRTVIQFIKMPASESLEAKTKQKLRKFYDRYSKISKINVFFKKENDPSPRGNICRIEFSLPGPKIFASANEANFWLALYKTLHDLERQMKKRKMQYQFIK